MALSLPSRFDGISLKSNDNISLLVTSCSVIILIDDSLKGVVRTWFVFNAKALRVHLPIVVCHGIAVALERRRWLSVIDGAA